MSEENGNTNQNDGQDGGDGGEGQAQQTQQTPTRPEYIAEKFWDPDAGSVRVESLAQAHADLEKMSRRRFEEMNRDERAELYNTLGFDPEKVLESDLRQKWENDRLADRPENASDYSFDAKEAGIPDTVEFDATADDPMLNWWRQFSHDQGFTNDQFGQGVAMWLNTLAGMQPDIEAERAKLGDNADARLDQAVSYLKKAGLDEAETQAIEDVVKTAAGVSALEKLALLALPPNSQDAAASSAVSKLTEDELRALQASPEYRRGDPVTMRKVEEGYAALYPEGAS